MRAAWPDLDSPATTLTLLKLNAVIGLTGFSGDSDSRLRSVGLQCALCHSTVDKSFSAPGIRPGNIGMRLDGWANRDLNVGALIALAPNLQPLAELLGSEVTMTEVRNTVLAWGLGRFDAGLLLDGKGFRPDGKTAAVLIPPAFGLAGVNLSRRCPARRPDPVCRAGLGRGGVADRGPGAGQRDAAVSVRAEHLGTAGSGRAAAPRGRLAQSPPRDAVPVAPAREPTSH
jgi:hypothetical protein